MVIIASLLGVGIFDGLGGHSSEFAGLLSFGLLLLVAMPVLIVILGVVLAVNHRKQSTRWVWLPVSTFIFSLIVFFLAIQLNPVLSDYSDCQLAHEDNPVKCGF